VFAGRSRSFCLSQELAEQWVVQLVAASSCADQHASLNEARAMLSVDFPGEVMRWNIAFGEARKFVGEREFFGVQLGNGREAAGDRLRRVFTGGVNP